MRRGSRLAKPARGSDGTSAPARYPPATVLRRTNLVDLIHDELHSRISDGVLVAGQRIIIDQVAAEFGTSLIPVREALARLHAQRLVQHEPNKGYRVAPAPDYDEMQRLFEARLIIEVGALESGFGNAGAGTVKELITINKKIASGRFGSEFASYRSFLDLNARFHQVIVALARNPFIDDAYQRLAYHERVAQTLSGRGPADITKIVAEHAAIIAAFDDGSLAKARAALRHHIGRGQHELLGRRSAEPEAR